MIKEVEKLLLGLKVANPTKDLNPSPAMNTM